MTIWDAFNIFLPLFLGVLMLAGVLSRHDSPWARIGEELSWAFSIVFLVYAIVASAQVFGATGENIGDTVIGLGIGMVGLVITALTGMALATAWRALDDAQKASQEAKNVVSYYDTMVDELTIISVYLEANRVADRHRVKNDDELEVAHILAAGFSRGAVDPAIECLVRLSKYHELSPIVKRILGPRGKSFLKKCLTSDNVKIAGDWETKVSRFI